MSMIQMPKIAFFLMNKKGLSVLKSIINKYSVDIIEYVVTSGDKGVEEDYSEEIIALCRFNGIRYYNKNETIPNFEGYKFAVGWRWLILDSQKLIVFHDSLLPRYRGFSPLVNMLINGETEIGVTSLLAKNDYDSGPIIMQKKIGISYPIKIDKAIELVSNLYQSLACEIVEIILNEQPIKNIVQNEDEATYSIWRDERDYMIDWRKDASYIKRFVDALGFPYGGAKSKCNNSYIIIDEVEVLEDVRIENRTPGKLIFFKDGYPVFICGSGLLKLVKVRSESGDFDIRDIKFRTRLEGE